MILLTGATGYIGSHTWVELLTRGYEVVGVDNFSNSNPLVLKRIKSLTQVEPIFHELDVGNPNLLEVFEKYSITAVIHFAALKAVGESVQKPVEYYQNNLLSLLNLLKLCRSHGVHQFVFSSSATVYHPENPIPYQENMRLGSGSPYGWSKVMSEQILRDFEMAYPALKVAYLRYFNPVGAHESGMIGEDPRGIPNNLMPYISQVAVGKRDYLSVYGGDWPTIDGTGVRDYIHVMDLAEGHVVALQYLDEKKDSITVNLGVGKGISVLQLLSAFERACGRKIPYKVVDRRAGDIAEFYADPSMAFELLNWKTKRSIDQMCLDAWRWQSKNPNGYES